MVYELTLPWPPTMNDYWHDAQPKRSDAALYAAGKLKRIPRHVYIAKRGKDYRFEVLVAVRGLRLNEPLRGRCYVAMLFRPPDRRRRDFDNLQKPLFDALEHARLFENDNQLKRGFWDEGAPDPPGGSVLLRIEELEPGPPQQVALELPDPAPF